MYNKSKVYKELSASRLAKCEMKGDKVPKIIGTQSALFLLSTRYPLHKYNDQKVVIFVLTLAFLNVRVSWD